MSIILTIDLASHYRLVSGGPLQHCVRSFTQIVYTAPTIICHYFRKSLSYAWWLTDRPVASIVDIGNDDGEYRSMLFSLLLWSCCCWRFYREKIVAAVQAGFQYNCSMEKLLVVNRPASQPAIIITIRDVKIINTAIISVCTTSTYRLEELLQLISDLPLISLLTLGEGDFVWEFLMICLNREIGQHGPTTHIKRVSLYNEFM